MTKIAVEQEKKSGDPEAPLPQAPPVYTSQAQIDNSAEMKQSRIWYVLSILATICCCLPCGVVGIVHSMLAHHDGETGRVGPQRTRLRKAKCCTCVSFGLGLFCLLIMLVFLGISWRNFKVARSERRGDDMDDMYKHDSIESYPSKDFDEQEQRPSMAPDAPVRGYPRAPNRGRDQHNRDD